MCGIKISSGTIYANFDVKLKIFLQDLKMFKFFYRDKKIMYDWYSVYIPNPYVNNLFYL